MDIKKKALEIALEKIRKFESCVLVAYRCPAGVWTIGYGETDGIKPRMVWTRDQAEEKLIERAAEFMDAVLAVCPLLDAEHPNKLAACTSLAYNIGRDAFEKSTVAKKINAGDFDGAATAFLSWNKAGGKVLNGLVRRRQEEMKLFKNTYQYD